jgi:hypothetical protein
MMRRMAPRQPYRPCRVRIGPERVKPMPQPPEPFAPDDHYFQLWMSELYLSYQQGWLSTYDPLLVVVSEFEYGGNRAALPVALGPTRLSERMRKTAGGIVYHDACVAGWHPYRGGPLHLTVMLCRVCREPETRALVRILERSASTVQAATSLHACTHVAGAIVSGVAELFKTGMATPIIGFRTTFAPNEGQEFVPGFYALVDAPEPGPEPALFSVQHNRLAHGTTPELAVPFRQADYVLCRVVQSHARDDVAAMPFFRLYERALYEAMQPDEQSWQRARASMLAFFASMYRHPDLTPAQAEMLRASCIAEMKRRRRQSLAAAGQPHEVAVGGAQERIG